MTAFGGFLGATQFLTRIPVRLRRSPDPARSVPWFPVVGGVAIVAVATGWWVGPLVVAAVVGAIVVTMLAFRAFGVIGGDVLGAVEQVGECLVLIVVSGLAARHTVWWA